MMYIGRDLSLKNNIERLMDFSQNMSTMISVHVKVNFSHFGPTFKKFISTYEKRILMLKIVIWYIIFGDGIK